jgi:hypothetical protein
MNTNIFVASIFRVKLSGNRTFRLYGHVARKVVARSMVRRGR